MAAIPLSQSPVLQGILREARDLHGQVRDFVAATPRAIDSTVMTPDGRLIVNYNDGAADTIDGFTPVFQASTQVELIRAEMTRLAALATDNVLEGLYANAQTTYANLPPFAIRAQALEARLTVMGV